MALEVFYPRKLSGVYPRRADDAAWQTLLDALDPEINIQTGEELPQPAEYKILVAGRPNVEQLTASPRLRTLVIPWAGMPVETAELMANYPQIHIHNLHHNAITTAETALMLLLMAAKQILPIERRFRENDWRPRYAPNAAVSLHGKTALILGYGSIGRHVGEVCAAMGMHVLGTQRHLTAPTRLGNAEIHPAAHLHRLLPQANALIVTLPLTDETRGLIGAEELSLLPPQAMVVNVGRGPVIDQFALYEALKNGHLHAAGLDVWYNYPQDETSRANTPPADVPFGQLENVVMSPHRGGGTTDIELVRMAHLAELLNTVVQGKPMPNQIHLERGY